MTHQIFIDDHRRADDLGRQAYHGGRTECFFIGKLNHPVYCFDVNSMYPFVMKTEDYPTKKVFYGRVPSVKELAQWLTDFAVVADVEVETDEPRYALLQNGKIIFPIGAFRTVLTTPDLLTAVRHSHLVRAFSFAVYEKAPIFKSFVDTLYRLRMASKASGDPVMTYNLKILMNSLYGKFGQTGRVWNTVDRTSDLSVRVWDELDAETGQLYNWRQFGGVIQVKETDAESYNSFPAIAAHVTAYARQLLWRYFELAGRENVYYCDTDSIFTNTKGQSRLATAVHETILGRLKHEKTFKWLTIHGPKDYQSDLGQTVKGVKLNAKWLNSNTVRQEEWKKIKGLLRRGDLSTPVILQKTKHLYRIYDKGTVTPSGFVEPYRLS